MAEIDLQEKFPDLRPIQSLPSLGTVNGIGTMMYGSRDHDAETGTYVKTHCFTFLFVPLASFGSYRVADAPGGGWYFIGKEPLSAFAKAWNFLLLFLVVGGAGFGWWSAVYNTEDARAGRAIAKAEGMADDGDPAGAAELLRTVVNGKSKKRADAERALRNVLAEAVESDDAAAARKVLDLTVDMQTAGEVDWGDEVHERGLALAERRAADDPKAAFEVLVRIEDVSPDEPSEEQEAASRKVRRAVLDRLVAAEPGNVEYAAALAALVNEDESMTPEDRMAACKKLLEPHEKSLGTTEGARVLGRIRVSQERFDDAYALLHPYCEGRLDALHEAESKYDAAVNAVNERFGRMIERNEIPLDVTRRLREAGENEEKQGEIVREWFAREMRDDRAVAAAQRQLLKTATVVPVALDLGIVLLQRARGAADPEGRQADLERAEETFLAIGGIAGGDAGYQMKLGQVKYWLGKQDEGRQLFDQVLVASNRSPKTLMGVATQYRELGEHATARALVEEAYESSDDESTKQSAAALRALTNTDLDDRIAWLRKANQSEPQVRASLAEAQGRKATEDGRDDEAIREYERALEIYDEQPETDTTLNNSSLVLQSLFGVTHDVKYLEEAVKRLRRAQRLNPSNAILAMNAGFTGYRVASLDLVGKEIDAELSGLASPQLSSFLCDDLESGDAWRKRVRDHEGMQQSITDAEKAILLAPTSPGLYELLAQHHRYLRDEAGLEGVLDRLEGVALDTEDRDRELRDHWAGKDDAKSRDEARKALDRARSQYEKVRGAGGASQAIAATTLLAAMTTLAAYEDVDADEVVRLADEAVAARASVGARMARARALFFRAHEKLKATNPGYAAFVEGSDRAHDAESLLALAAVHDEALRPAILGQEDVKAAIEAATAIGKVDPDEHRTYVWALLSVGDDPDTAEVVAEVLHEDRLARLQNAISARTNPLTSPISEYWYLRLEGKEDEATALLRKAREAGIPLPGDLGK